MIFKISEQIVHQNKHIIIYFNLTNTDYRLD